MIALPPLAQGTTFAGEYRIVELLSHTNQLALYGAAHVPSGEMRVLELIFAPVVPGAAFRDRFARAAIETSVAAGPFVPRVEAAGIDGPSQVPFVAMEPFRGEVLATAAARNGGIPIAEAMDILGQIASGLGQLHIAGLVHGGLRPDAVVLTASPTQRPGVKLLNASLAKVLGDARAAVAPSAPPCDPAWASPEQIKGEAATIASDVYSFALLAFTVFTGQRVWRGTGDAPIVREATKEALPIPTARAYELGRGGTLPSTFDGWFARAAARSPSERHANLHDAFTDLQASFHRAAMAYTGSLGASAMSSTVLMPPAAPRSSGNGKTAFVAIASFAGMIVLGGIGVVGYFAVNRYKERAQEAPLEAQRVVETKTSAADISGDKPAPRPDGTPSTDTAGGEPPSVDIGSLPSAGAGPSRRRQEREAKAEAAKPESAKPESAKASGAGAAGASNASSSGAPSSPASLLEAAPTGATKLQVVDLTPGKGKAAKSGDTITVRYVGKRQSDGATYDTSHATSPYTFALGSGKVTKGWEQGIPGMKVGGKRRLVVPPQLAYGEKGLGSSIPPNSTLIFDLELVSID